MISLQNICSGYDGRNILEDIDLEIHDGEIFAVIGPNGSGKSTLLKTVTGIIPKSSGKIIINGRNADTFSARELAQKVSYLSQSRNAPNISVRKLVLHGRFPYLGYPRHYEKEDYAIVDKALRRVGAEAIADYSLAELSGGQQQKAYIAMTLAQDTPTVLLDEPTTFLDIAHQLRLMNIARGMVQEGRSVVVVLHDLPLAMHSSDRVAVMSKGKTVCVGTPEEVYESGSINSVFGVRLLRYMTEDGYQYYFKE